MSELLDGVGRSHLLMPSIGMSSDSWKTERSASQPLSPMPTSPFQPSPLPSPAANPTPLDTNNLTGHHTSPFPSYSPPPAPLSLPPPSSDSPIDGGVVPPVEINLLHSTPFPIPPSSRGSIPQRLVPSSVLSVAAEEARGKTGDRRAAHRVDASVVRVERTPLWPSPPSSHISISALLSLGFNCFDYSEDQLLVCTVHTLEHLNLIKGLDLSLSHLQVFLLSIRAHYRNNPYHNFFHGFAVFQFGFYMLCSSKLMALLTPHDQLVLLISCLCHDVDHPGTTNSFQVAVDSGLARVHNELAVLENHHAFMTCELMRHEASNFLHGVSALQFRQFRKMVVQAILATDMFVHFDLCRQFARFDKDLEKYDGAKEEDRQLMINVLTHSSDLSAQVMDFTIASLWESRVTAEFMAQSELEVELGVAATPSMERLHEPSIRYKNHLNFLDFIMQPLWTVVSVVLPPMTKCRLSLLDNRSHYERRLQEANHSEERRPLQNSALPSSSAPSSTPISVSVSAVASPSISATHSPQSLSPSVRATAAAQNSSLTDFPSSLPSSTSPSPSTAYQALRDDAEDLEEEVADSNALHKSQSHR